MYSTKRKELFLYSVVAVMICSVLISLFVYLGTEKKENQSMLEAFEHIEQKEEKFVFLEPIQVSDLVQRKMERWKDQPAETILYTLSDSISQFDGRLDQNKHWVVEGKNHSGKDFTIAFQEEKAIFTIGEYTESLFKEEVQYITPTAHLDIIYKQLRDEEYELTSWEQTENGYQLELVTQPSWLQEDFREYLHSHLKRKEKVDNLMLDHYTLHYILSFQGEGVSTFELDSLTVFLDRTGVGVEKMFFDFK
ncbi:hypothetical protein [Caldalkalibacillus mannanilyticus]|uniref:hypothetical protein n=1 Tax=Caldalkalibacillus mannanilyticus TaxID=1418 RepID=UPI00046A78AB|nr:hypothetical protein [Caldalkalibacillus mannanilyticus]